MYGTFSGLFFRSYGRKEKYIIQLKFERYTNRYILSKQIQMREYSN